MPSKRSLGIIAVSMALSTSASSTPVTFSYEAIPSWFMFVEDTPQLLAAFDVLNGTPARIDFTFDPDNPNTSSPLAGDYGPLDSVVLTVDGHSFTGDVGSYMYIADGQIDAFGVNSPLSGSGFDGRGYTVVGVEFDIYDETGEALNSEDLPSTPFDPSLFPGAELTINLIDINGVFGAINTTGPFILVPEPAVGAALTLPGFLFRRTRPMTRR